MKKILLLFITFFCVQNSFSQNSFPENDIQKKIYNNEDVQVKAEFQDGEKKFNEYVVMAFKKEKHKDYPKTVLASFIVGIDGSLEDVEIVSGGRKNASKEIKKIIENSPKWLPAEHEGYRVRASVKVSLNFQE
ncbi:MULTISPECIES: energy transducer TonB [Flavobacterium]|uniref:energy transducer TonB n=1 Tax=Flavobacterium TaxID=237 RepID=UPI0021158DC6|nr:MULTISPECIES: hypothetical protein [Flavobacterium]UUF12938.1 hypothetical protein NLJ00_16895 [Flavobacterium panici]